jgi:glutaminyl-tRNA synthetase
VQLIATGKAYVDSLNEEEIRQYRGTVTEAGKPQPLSRAQRGGKSRRSFAGCAAGEFPDGAHVLRAKIDMAAPNMKMRDPLLYRIRHASHYRTGDEWCIYPMYDYAHRLSDAIEGITHSICTWNLRTTAPLYDWLLDSFFAEPRPHQYEFARLNVEFMRSPASASCCKLVEGQAMCAAGMIRVCPRLSGMRRRGYTPEAIRLFCRAGLVWPRPTAACTMDLLEDCHPRRP